MRNDPFRQVEAFYLNATASGVSLSPADAYILRLWLRMGITPEVICRGIARTLGRVPRGAQPRGSIPSLTRCRDAVEAEQLHTRDARLRERWQAPSSEDRGARLRGLLARIDAVAASTPGLADAYRLARARLVEAGGAGAELLDELDADLCRAALRAMAPAQRAAVLAEAESKLVPGERGRTRERSLRAHVRVLLREQIDLRCISDLEAEE